MASNFEVLLVKSPTQACSVTMWDKVLLHCCWSQASHPHSILVIIKEALSIQLYSLLLYPASLIGRKFLGT